MGRTPTRSAPASTSPRHLVVLDNDEVAGIISVRDIVRVWSQARTTATA
jgi:CBS domain-containing protein